MELQRLCRSHHLHCRTSSKGSEKLEKSLCVRDKAEDLYWMPVVFWPSDDTASLIGRMTLQTGPGILPETTVSKPKPPCHLQMSSKALSRKKEVIFEHGPEVPLCPVGPGSFKMDHFKVESVLWSDKSEFDILVGNQGGCVLKRRETLQCFISIQFKISDGMEVHKYTQLACFGRNYEHWKACKGFRATDTPLHMSKMTTNSSAAGNLYQARMGPNSNTETSETHDLDAQMSSNCLKRRDAPPWWTCSCNNYFETCNMHQIWNKLIFCIKL